MQKDTGFQTGYVAEVLSKTGWLEELGLEMGTDFVTGWETEFG